MGKGRCELVGEADRC